MQILQVKAETLAWYVSYWMIFLSCSPLPGSGVVYEIFYQGLVLILCETECCCMLRLVCSICLKFLFRSFSWGLSIFFCSCMSSIASVQLAQAIFWEIFIHQSLVFQDEGLSLFFLLELEGVQLWQAGNYCSWSLFLESSEWKSFWCLSVLNYYLSEELDLFELILSPDDFYASVIVIFYSSLYTLLFHEEYFSSQSGVFSIVESRSELVLVLVLVLHISFTLDIFCNLTAECTISQFMSSCELSYVGFFRFYVRSTWWLECTLYWQYFLPFRRNIDPYFFYFLVI